MATDPVCGMQVDEAKASQAEHQGRRYYFCSDGCRKKFEQNPSAYVPRS